MACLDKGFHHGVLINEILSLIPLYRNSPLRSSCIHDHTDAHCFMKMLDGSLLETQYDWPKGSGPMHITKETSVAKDEVVYINGR